MMKFSKVRPKDILRDFCTMETHTYITVGDTHMFDENIKKVTVSGTFILILQMF